MRLTATALCILISMAGISAQAAQPDDDGALPVLPVIPELVQSQSVNKPGCEKIMPALIESESIVVIDPFQNPVRTDSLSLLVENHLLRAVQARAEYWRERETVVVQLGHDSKVDSHH